ncbi:MAG: trypsin-like peptidase domain-containing protein [Candidatus Improbicoccus devescovinae]|nr:MAG: trypsin-like peptidase domain-containing protein [Candidatus Improbicoccus devescovinae]
MEENFNNSKDQENVIFTKYYDSSYEESSEKLMKEPEIINYTNNTRKNKILIRIILVLIAFLILFGSALMYLWQTGDINFSSIINNVRNNSSNSDSLISFEDSPEGENALSAEQIYEKVNKSVVGVAMYDSDADIFSDLAGQGSGIILSEDGYVVTNAHVIGTSAKNRITVIFKDSEKSEEVESKIIGFDKKTDIAVLKIDKKNLQPAKFADSSKIKTGSVCYTLGNPVGLDFYSSLTKGIVSGVERSVNKSEVKYIQTDAAINPGNSGGGLFNCYGYVIGMNTWKLRSVEIEGIGFAIPSSKIQEIANAIIKKGYVPNRPKLGMTCKMVSSAQAQHYNIPEGLIIIDINKNSDLNSKGVLKNDIITHVNSKKLTEFDVLSEEISKNKVGDAITLTIYRRPKLLSSDEPKTFNVHVILIEDKNEITDNIR